MEQQKPIRADSSTWRINRSNIPIIELANAIRSLRRVIGMMDDRTISVAFNSYKPASYNSASAKTIRIDPTFAMKGIPIATEDFDVLVGLASHEAMHSRAQSEEIPTDYQGLHSGDISPDTIAAVGEEVYCDQLARRHFPMAFQYLRKSREAYTGRAVHDANWDNILIAWMLVSVYGLMPPPSIPQRTSRALRILSDASLKLSRKDCPPHSRRTIYDMAYTALRDITREIEVENQLRRKKLQMQEGESWKVLEDQEPQPNQGAAQQQQSDKGQSSEGSSESKSQGSDSQPKPESESDHSPGDSQDEGDSDAEYQETDSEANEDAPGQDTPKPSPSSSHGGSPGDVQNPEPGDGSENEPADDEDSTSIPSPSNPTDGDASGDSNHPTSGIPKPLSQQKPGADFDPNALSPIASIHLKSDFRISEDLESAINEAIDSDLQDILADLVKLDSFRDKSKKVEGYGDGIPGAVTIQRVKPDPDPNFDHDLYNQLVWVKFLRNSIERVTDRGQEHGLLDGFRLHRALMDGRPFKKNRRREHQKTRLVLLLDASGSMGDSDNPVYQAAAALHRAVPGEVSVYSYYTSLLGSVGYQVNIEDHSAHRQFDRIRTEGGTPSGIALLAIAMRHRDALIVHFTDGHSNSGISPKDSWTIIEKEFPRIRLVDIRVRPQRMVSLSAAMAIEEITESSRAQVLHLDNMNQFSETLREAIRPWYMSL